MFDNMNLNMKSNILSLNSYRKIAPGELYALGTWYKLLISGDVVLFEKLLGQIQPWLGPLDIEVQRKCYAVVFIIDFQHIRDFNTCKKTHSYTINTLQPCNI